jgi:dual specificity phosphatase 3
MSDFSFVTSRIATGAALSGPEDVAALAVSGITHVVDCRAEFDDAPLFGEGPMLYLWNGTADDGQPKEPGWFAKSLVFAMPALGSFPNSKILFHSSAGVNRGPSTAYAVLRALGLSPALSEALIRKARPQVGLAYMRDADRAVAALGYA